MSGPAPSNWNSTLMGVCGCCELRGDELPSTSLSATEMVGRGKDLHLYPRISVPWAYPSRTLLQLTCRNVTVKSR